MYSEQINILINMYATCIVIALKHIIIILQQPTKYIIYPTETYCVQQQDSNTYLYNGQTN